MLLKQKITARIDHIRQITRNDSHKMKILSEIEITDTITTEITLILTNLVVILARFHGMLHPDHVISRRTSHLEALMGLFSEAEDRFSCITVPTSASSYADLLYIGNDHTSFLKKRPFLAESGLFCIVRLHSPLLYIGNHRLQ